MIKLYPGERECALHWYGRILDYSSLRPVGKKEGLKEKYTSVNACTETEGDMEEKTNVMRILEQKKIWYQPHYYNNTEALSGAEVARILGEDPSCVFKTLVTEGKSKQHYVFVIPVAEELDLKKAARAVGEKSIAMLKAKELLSLTGYVHGGCSPVGMKKFFLTTIDKQIEGLEHFFFSAGKIGAQVEMAPEDLKKVIRYQVADVV